MVEKWCVGIWLMVWVSVTRLQMHSLTCWCDSDTSHLQLSERQCFLSADGAFDYHMLLSSAFTALKEVSH